VPVIRQTRSLWERYEGLSDMTRLFICFSCVAEVRKSSGTDPSPSIHCQFEPFLPTLFLPWQSIGKVFNEGNCVALQLIAPQLNVVLPKPELLRMVLLALALHTLSAYFGVAICNMGCSRKPQNQYSIRLLAPIHNRKSFNLLLISDALGLSRNEVCKRYAKLFAHRIWLCLAKACCLAKIT
jgi:hypothetical protein